MCRKLCMEYFLVTRLILSATVRPLADELLLLPPMERKLYKKFKANFIFTVFSQIYFWLVSVNSYIIFQILEINLFLNLHTEI